MLSKQALTLGLVLGSLAIGACSDTLTEPTDSNPPGSLAIGACSDTLTAPPDSHPATEPCLLDTPPLGKGYVIAAN